MRSYDSFGRPYKYQVKPNGIAVDLGRRVVTVTATHETKEPVSVEFPTLLVRTCKKCKQPVVIYAEGSMSTLCALIGTFASELFRKPEASSYDDDWTHLPVEGGFVLMADHGHAHKQETYNSRYGTSHHWKASCKEHGLRLAVR